MLHWFAERLREVQEKDKKGEKGFTLIELLVVIIINGRCNRCVVPGVLTSNRRAGERVLSLRRRPVPSKGGG